MYQSPKMVRLLARAAWHGLSCEGSAASSWMQGEEGAGSMGRSGEEGTGCWPAHVVVHEMSSCSFSPIFCFPSTVLSFSAVLLALWAFRAGKGETFQVTFPLFWQWESLVCSPDFLSQGRTLMDQHQGSSKVEVFHFQKNILYLFLPSIPQPCQSHLPEGSQELLTVRGSLCLKPIIILSAFPEKASWGASMLLCHGPAPHSTAFPITA